MAASNDRIVFVTLAWLLTALLYGFLLLRWLTLRQSPPPTTTTRRLRTLGTILVYAIVLLATAYTSTVTWFALWSDPLNLVETGGITRLAELEDGKEDAAASVVGELNVLTVMRAQIALNVLYVAVVWLAKAVVLVVCLEAWGGLGLTVGWGGWRGGKAGVGRVWWAWWAAAGGCVVAWVGTFVAVLVKGVGCLKTPGGEGGRAEVLHFAGGHDFFTKKLVLLVGLANILTTILLITTSLLTIRALRKHTTHANFRTTLSAFLTAILSILLEAIRIATAHYPHGRRSWSDSLAMCQVFLWAAAVCLPGIVLARTSTASTSTPSSNRPRPSEYTYSEKEIEAGGGIYAHEKGGYMSGSSRDSSPTGGGGRSGPRATRNPKNLHVRTTPDGHARGGAGYTLAQGDNHAKVLSAPLFAAPEKAALRSARTPGSGGGGGRTPRTPRRGRGRVLTGVEAGSSADEAGSGPEAEGCSSEEEGALRSGVLEGREWRRGMNDEVRRPGSARLSKGGGGRY